MNELGLSRTHLARRRPHRRLGDPCRRLRTSPADLVHLLALMARGELVDQWSSNEMIAILKADEFNTLLPEPLPADVPIAHKTGSLYDTLNDAGIVFAERRALRDRRHDDRRCRRKDLGRDFIHSDLAARLCRRTAPSTLAPSDLRRRAEHGPFARRQLLERAARPTPRLRRVIALTR